MAKTLREKFIQALTKIGETEVKRTHKFVVFSRKEGGYWYIGASGSLRYGQTVATSYPAPSYYKHKLIAADVS